MWNESTDRTLFAAREAGGVAPARHELAKRAYIEKARSRHEAEQRAATTGALYGSAGKFLTRMGAWLTSAKRVTGRVLVLQTRP